jgi:ferredoxin
LKIVIDRDKCMGSGNCAFHAPHTFDLDDEMKVVVLDSKGDPAGDIANAVDGCPTKSLSLEGE